MATATRIKARAIRRQGTRNLPHPGSLRHATTRAKPARGRVLGDSTSDFCTFAERQVSDRVRRH